MSDVVKRYIVPENMVWDMVSESTAPMSHEHVMVLATDYDALYDECNVWKERACKEAVRAFDVEQQRDALLVALGRVAGKRKIVKLPEWVESSQKEKQSE